MMLERKGVQHTLTIPSVPIDLRDDTNQLPLTFA